MKDSKRTWRTHIAIASMMTVVFLSALIIGSSILNFFLVPLSGPHEAMRKFPKNIDVAIVGTSRSYRAVNTAMASNITGITWYNMSTPAQTSVEKLFYTRELYKKHTPDVVFFEIQVSSYIREKHKFAGVTTVELSWDKIKHVADWDSNPISFLRNTFFPFARHLDKTFRVKKIAKNVKEKTTSRYVLEDYDNIVFKDSADGLSVQDFVNFHGYRYTSQTITPGSWGNEEFHGLDIMTNQFGEGKTSSKQIKALKEAIKYAQAKGSRVVLYNPPFPYMMLGRYSEIYQSFLEYTNQIATELGTDFYDFTFVKKSKFNRHPLNNESQSLPEQDYYYDGTHFNGAGATEYTRLLIDFYNDIIIGGGEASDYLLDNVEEVFEDAPYIYQASLNFDKTAQAFKASTLHGNNIKPLQYCWQYRYNDQRQYNTIIDYDNGESELTAEELFSLIDNVKDGKLRVRVLVRQQETQIEYEQFDTALVTIKNKKII